MRIKLIKLHSNPEIFDPIEFYDGVNLILGEKVTEEDVRKGKKTNGVGKSLCVEFINFCLLKDSKESRVMKIPLDKFNEDTEILLDLEINSEPLTIIRTKQNPNSPTIIRKAKSTIFSSLDDANKYLEDLLFKDAPSKEKMSFREFLGPFLREEESEFKDILSCYDLTKRIPANIKPHAYLFQIDVSLIDSIKKYFKKIDSANDFKKEFIKILTEGQSRKLSDVKTTLNALNDDILKIDLALEGLRTNEAFEAHQEDLVKFQTSIDQLRTRQVALKYEIKRINSLPIPEKINEQDIEIVYNQFKSGLGSIVSKSIREVIEFKGKIDEFQRRLFDEKRSSLEEELEKVSSLLAKLEEERGKSLTIIDSKGVFKDVKSGFAIYEGKKSRLHDLQSNYENYEKYEKEWKTLKHENESNFLKLDEKIDQNKKIIESFNQTILKIHEFIMDSNETYFDIKTKNTPTSKQILSFEMRIDDDGSHSVDRTKVFIYDLALLLNEYTRERHPKLLIHDNIFDVDQDTLLKSLNYLSQKESTNFQYILTLNRDKIEKEESESLIDLNIDAHKVADFTKAKRFLHGGKYSEIY